MNIGINPTAVRTSEEGAEFRVGTLMGYDHPTYGYQEFLYVQAGEAITGLGYMCLVASDGVAEMIDTTSSAPGVGQGMRAGAAQAAIEADGYGWLQVYGRGSCRTLADAAVGTALTSSATPGALDDATTAGLEVIDGVSLGTVSGGAPETNGDAYFNYPTVGRTL